MPGFSGLGSRNPNRAKEEVLEHARMVSTSVTPPFLFSRAGGPVITAYVVGKTGFRRVLLERGPDRTLRQGPWTTKQAGCVQSSRSASSGITGGSAKMQGLL